MDIVFIHDLQVETLIGIYAWEREVKQWVNINLEMAADIKTAAQTDEIKYALNYKAVAKRIIDFVAHSEFFLIETMAEKIADIVRDEFAVPWVRLEVSKPGAVRGSRSVGVRIERGEKF